MQLPGGIFTWLCWLVAFAPVGGLFSWHVWNARIRPRMIPAEDIARLADELVARHGAQAEDIAFIEQDRAWRSSEVFQQGKWHRVRRELQRRAGERNGP